MNVYISGYIRPSMLNHYPSGVTQQLYGIIKYQNPRNIASLFLQRRRHIVGILSFNRTRRV
jgi:hypothetical protein